MANFNSFAENILNDAYFRNQRITNTRAPYNPIRLNDHLDASIETLREALLERYYHEFEFDNLQMIVVASSGVETNRVNYNKVLAMVAEEGVDGIPYAVQRLIVTLNKAFDLEERGPPVLDNGNYDFTCSRLMDRVLFLNVCLSATNSWDDDYANCAVTVRFINQILKYKREHGQRLAVLDQRITMHRHVNNYNTDITQDRNAANPETENRFYQDDAHFEIFNPDDFHLYRKFGNPGIYHFDADNDTTFYVEMLREIQAEGFPIEEMYLPIGRNLSDFKHL